MGTGTATPAYSYGYGYPAYGYGYASYDHEQELQDPRKANQDKTDSYCFTLIAVKHKPKIAGVRLLTRKGHDWAPRYPLIVEAATRCECAPA